MTNGGMAAEPTAQMTKCLFRDLKGSHQMPKIVRKYDFGSFPYGLIN